MERTEKGDKEIMEKRPESDLTRAEAFLKKAEEQLGVEIHMDKDQKAKADAGKAEIRLVPMEIVWAIACTVTASTEIRRTGRKLNLSVTEML